MLTNGKVPAARGGSPSAPGALAPGADVINVKAGEGVRLQLASAATTRYFRLRMTDQTGQQVTLFRIGGQGGLLDAVRVEGGIQGSLNTLYKPGEILLPVAAREDVVFVVPEGKNGDIVTLWTLDYPRIGTGPSPVPGQGAFSGLPTVPVAHFRIVGAASRNERFTIAAGDPLLLHPAVNAPIENLKGLTPDALIDPPPATGSADETLRLTTEGASGDRQRRRLPLRRRAARRRLHDDSQHRIEPLCRSWGPARADDQQREHMVRASSLAPARVLDPTGSIRRECGRHYGLQV